jgi:hypothetical protein
MIEDVQAKAEVVVRLMRPLTEFDFGYTRESVEWLEGYIERVRQCGEFRDEQVQDRLVSAFGAFLGECVVRCYGGVWAERDETWCVAFPGDNFVFPFAKVSKQMKHGLVNGIGSFFRALAVVCKHCGRVPAQPMKPWWRSMAV